MNVLRKNYGLVGLLLGIVFSCTSPPSTNLLNNEPELCSNHSNCPADYACVARRCVLSELCTSEGKEEACYARTDGLKSVSLQHLPCKAGKKVCKGGFWSSCENAVYPATEICGNQKDDDCDGFVDNGCKESCQKGTPDRKCYQGDPSTRGVGLCKEGVQKCDVVSGTWGECLGQILPIKEEGALCNNGKDDNCDSFVDECSKESCNPLQDSKRECYSGTTETQNKGECKAGFQICQQDKKWENLCREQVLPRLESCKGGKDLDCDGIQDNCKNPFLLVLVREPADNLVSFSLKSEKEEQRMVVASPYSALLVVSNVAITGNSFGTLIARDLETSFVLWSQNFQKRAIVKLLLDPTSQAFYSIAEGGAVSKIDAKTGNLLLSFQIATSLLQTVAVSGDGKYFVSSHTDKRTVVWDLSVLVPQELKVYEEELVTSIHFSKDHNFLLLIGLTKINLWKVGTWDLQQGVALPTGDRFVDASNSSNSEFFHLGAWSQDGLQFLLSSSHGKVRFFRWIAQKLEWVNTVSIDANQKTILSSLRATEDNQTFLLGTTTGKVLFWDTTKGNIFLQLSLSSFEIYEIFPIVKWVTWL